MIPILSWTIVNSPGLRRSGSLAKYLSLVETEFFPQNSVSSATEKRSLIPNL